MRLWTVAGLLGFCCIVCAQTEAKLEFEAATVKPAAPLTRVPPPRGGPGTSDPGYVRYTFLSMKNLLMTAYELPAQQITGPAWIDSERYDIAARVSPGATAEQVKVMLRNLLADRFRLVVHPETREIPLYELTVAKNRPKIKLYVEDPNEPAREPGQVVFSKDGLPLPRLGSIAATMAPDAWTIVGRKNSVERLAVTLANQLGRPVVDKTGLTGEYDFSVRFKPVRTSNQPDADSDAPDLLVAVQEQLGLKLESKKGPIEMLVVDSGQRTPTEN